MSHIADDHRSLARSHAARATDLLNQMMDVEDRDDMPTSLEALAHAQASLAYSALVADEDPLT